MANKHISSKQETQIFRKFGYGLIRLVSGSRLRKIANESEPSLSHDDIVIDKVNTKGVREVTFNGDCESTHFIDIGHKCKVGAYYDKKTGNVEIVPNTLYLDGGSKPIDLKKRGGIFWKSDLEHAVGKNEAKEVLKDYKDMKLAVYSNPKDDGAKAQAASMVGGRSNGKTILSKLPNALFNTAIFLFSPLLYLISGGRTAHSKTDAMRDKMSAYQTNDSLRHYNQKSKHVANDPLETETNAKKSIAGAPSHSVAPFSGQTLQERNEAKELGA